MHIILIYLIIILFIIGVIISYIYYFKNESLKKELLTLKINNQKLINSIQNLNIQIEKSKYEEIYVPITFPEVQKYIEREGFDSNSVLINSEAGVIKYGLSSYLVNKKWIINNVKEL